jgi:hypothetical protein
MSHRRRLRLRIRPFGSRPLDRISSFGRAMVGALAIAGITAGAMHSARGYAAATSALPSGSAPAVATIRPWKLQAAPMAWANGRIYYRQKGKSGLFEGWSADPDGSDAKCLTCGSAYPRGTQHGISDVTPDGRYALATIERSHHVPVPDGTYLAAPGNGAYNDLWLQTTDGSRAWRLTNSLTSHAGALIWPRFDSTGTRVVWSEQWRWGLPFGAWRMYVADLEWSNGTPSLANRKLLQSTGFLEPYGFTSDGSHVLFAADALAGTTWNNLQIMTLPANLAGTPTRLSPRDASTHKPWSNYNEFAFAMPGSNRIILGRSVGAFYKSLEYWTINPDGSDPKQLTWLSQPLSGQYRGHPSLAGGLAFNPANPSQFVAGIGTDYNGDYKSLLITLT